MLLKNTIKVFEPNEYGFGIELYRVPCRYVLFFI